MRRMKVAVDPSNRMMYPNRTTMIPVRAPGSHVGVRPLIRSEISFEKGAIASAPPISIINMPMIPQTISQTK